MQIEFYKDDGVIISHLHLTAETDEEQAMLDQLQTGPFTLGKDPAHPTLVWFRRQIFAHATGEAHGLALQDHPFNP
jgi:hypothetical protein